MSKIVLNDVTNGSFTQMNRNFQKIEDTLNDLILYRVNPSGTPNQMENDLDMNSNDILNAGIVKAKRVVADSIDGTAGSVVEGGIKDDEIVKWDTTTAKFIGTGVFSLSDGELTTKPNSVNIGIHDVGSAGRNVIVTNRVDNSHWYPVVQEIGLSDSDNTGPIGRYHSGVEDVVWGSSSSEVLVDPSWTFTNRSAHLSVFGVLFWPEIDMTNVHYQILEQGKVIFEENLGDFTAGDNSTFKTLKTPYDVYQTPTYTLRLFSPDGATRFRGDSLGNPWRKAKVRPFTMKELATKEYVDLHAGAGADVMTKSVYDIDGDGVVDVAKTIVGASTAGNSKYFGTDFRGQLGFHDVPNNTGGSGEPSDYTQVKAQVSANTAAISNHAKQIQSNLAADQAMQSAIQDITNDLPDIKNELNDATSKIEANILNINALQKAGKTVTLTNSGDTAPQWPDEQHGNYLLTQKLQTRTIAVETPFPTGGMVDGALLTIFNESPSNSVRLVRNAKSGDTVNQSQFVNIPPENFASFVYQLKDKNFLELESGYIPAARVNIANFVKGTLNADGVLHTEAEIRRLVDTGGYIKGLTVEDKDGHSLVKVNKLVFDNLEVGPDSNEAFTAHVLGGASSGDALIDIHMAPPNQQFGGKANEIIVEPPLSVFSDPDSTNGNAVRFEIEQGTFEPLQAPNFLAYLKDDEKILGKLPQGASHNALSHHQGSLWFSDVIHSGGPYIQVNRNDKTFGIQEADDLDPNVTGGTDYLIAARVHMKGNAPSDGMVRLYLYNKSVTPYSPTGYLMDTNGQPMAVERQYKQGQELGVLDIISIVNAKSLQEFSVHIVDNFSNDFVTITDRTEGASGILIQALKSDSKTGLGLLQFESDTNQNIEFSSHYLGEDRFNLEFLNSQDETVTAYDAGRNLNLVDGLLLQNRSGIKVGVVDGRTVITDDGTHSADFAFGKIFSAEETHMLRGKTVDLTMVTTTHQNASRVFAVSWSGTPDVYTPNIIASWLNDTPTFSTSWSKFDEVELVENAVSQDNIIKKTVTIPMDAENYGFIVTPNTGPVSPFKVEIKDLAVDVKPSFIGYALHAPELLHEIHLVNSRTHNKFVQDAGSYASVRYTINQNVDGQAIPVGTLRRGKGPVELDTTVNQIPSSEIKIGEGALDFTADGQATVTVRLRLWNEQTTASQVKFWFVMYDVDGNETKLPDSEQTFTVPAGAKEVIQTFQYVHDFTTGDRIGLRASADKNDGAFLQCVSNSRPLIEVDVDYSYLTSQGGNPGDDPWTGLDMSQFDYVYTHMMAGRLVARNTSSIEVLS